MRNPHSFGMCAVVIVRFPHAEIENEKRETCATIDFNQQHISSMNYAAITSMKP